MRVTLEKLGSLERRLHIVVPTTQVDKALASRMRRIASTAKMSGFRKGKVPLTLITQQHGPAVQQEVLSELIKTSLMEALAKEKLRPATTPTVSPAVSIPGQSFEFTATFEVFPEMSHLHFVPMTLEVEKVVITEDDISTTLEKIRAQWSTPETGSLTDEMLLERLKLGNKTIEDLRKEIAAHLQREGESIVRRKIKKHIYDVLLEQNLLEVPAGLVEQETDRLHNETCNQKSSHIHTEEEKSKMAEAAKRNVTLGFILQGLIEKYGIRPSEEKINEILLKNSSVYEKPEEIMRWYRKHPGMMQEIILQVSEDSLIDYLLGLSTVNEKTVSFAELVPAAEKTALES